MPGHVSVAEDICHSSSETDVQNIFEIQKKLFEIQKDLSVVGDDLLASTGPLRYYVNIRCLEDLNIERVIMR
jgi:hypothetical protein